MRKARITYRFDHEQPQHGQAVEEPQKSDNDTMERAAVEQAVIDQREPFTWQPAFHSDGPRSGSGWKIALSIGGAIATGLLFGAFIMGIFSQAGTDEMAQMPVEPNTTATPTVQITEPNPLQETVGSGPVAISVSLPERRLFMLQNGVFASLDGARMLVETMKNKGLAATIEEGASFYVYAGVSSNREAALRVGRRLQEANVEVYVKPYELPVVNQLVMSSETASQSFVDYIHQGSGLVQMIGDLTLVHLEENEPIALESSTITTLQTTHFAYNEISSAVVANLPASGVTIHQRMNQAIRTAMMALQEYNANPDHAFLWSAQSALMDYIIAEKRLLQAVSMP
jgi:stage II sporulation protein B